MRACSLVSGWVSSCIQEYTCSFSTAPLVVRVLILCSRGPSVVNIWVGEDMERLTAAWYFTGWTEREKQGSSTIVNSWDTNTRFFRTSRGLTCWLPYCMPVVAMVAILCWRREGLKGWDYVFTWLVINWKIIAWDFSRYELPRGVHILGN